MLITKCFVNHINVILIDLKVQLGNENEEGKELNIVNLSLNVHINFHSLTTG
jgi:hypothetical protein